MAEVTRPEKASGGKKKKAPLRRAGRWGRTVPALARRLALMLVLTVVLGMLFSGVAAVGSFWVRMLLSGVVLLAVLFLYLNEGLAAGTKDAAESRRVRKQEKEGKPVSDREDAACWHPAKPLLAALIVFGVPMLLAAYIALTAEGYTYTLQDLPTWVQGSYSAREDIMAPLSAYMEAGVTGPRVFLRLTVRLMEMIFVGFFTDPQKSAALLDGLAPAFLAAYPLTFIAGYLLGPKRQSRLAAKERKAKKVAVRRAERRTLAEELTRGGGEVHYGQRNDAPGKGKKLI